MRSSARRTACSSLPATRCKCFVSVFEASRANSYTRRSLAYRAGVTTGIVAPQTRGFLAGLNTAFSTGARHKLEMGALVQEAGAVHVAIHPIGSPSVSTQIAALRHLLLGETSGDVKEWFKKIKRVRP